MTFENLVGRTLQLLASDETKTIIQLFPSGRERWGGGVSVPRKKVSVELQISGNKGLLHFIL